MALIPNVTAFVAKKLQVYGRSFGVARPNSAAVPLANILGSTMAFPYRNPKGHGDADWLLMIEEDLARPGDYLLAGGETYIYGLRPHLMPAQAMRCNHTIALLRAPVSVGVGVQPYAGACAAESSAVLGTVVNGAVVDGWPASILIGGRQAAGTNLPMAVQNGGFEVMLPKTVPIAIRASDILLDNLGRRFIADTCELSELGWRMTVKEVHP